MKRDARNYIVTGSRTSTQRCIPTYSRLIRENIYGSGIARERGPFFCVRGTPLRIDCTIAKEYHVRLCSAWEECFGNFSGLWPAFFSFRSCQWSPRAHLHVVGMLRFMFDINQPSLPAPFCFCSCVYFCLFGPFNCISFHKFSWQLSAFQLCSSGLVSALLVLSTVYHFMKVSFSPDMIPSGWLGSKHQITN